MFISFLITAAICVWGGGPVSLFENHRLAFCAACLFLLPALPLIIAVLPTLLLIFLVENVIKKSNVRYAKECYQKEQNLLQAHQTNIHTLQTLSTVEQQCEALIVRLQLKTQDPTALEKSRLLMLVYQQILNHVEQEINMQHINPEQKEEALKRALSMPFEITLCAELNTKYTTSFVEVAALQRHKSCLNFFRPTTATTQRLKSVGLTL